MRKSKSKLTSTKKSGAEQKRPDLFRYHDYLDFLKDWSEYNKREVRGFSLRSLAKEAGLASGYLSMVLAKKRPLSQKAMLKLVAQMRLDPAEKKYFQALVQLGTAATQELRLAALAQMKRFHSYQNENRKELEVHEYLTRWYYVAIREMAMLKDFQMDPEWIQARLNTRISRDEIKQALEFLVKNAYLEVNAQGRAEIQQRSLECVGGVYKVALTQFHQEMLSLASSSITDTAADCRELMGHTFALNDENFLKAREIIVESVQKLRELAETSQNGTQIYHAELALFPLTKRPTK